MKRDKEKYENLINHSQLFLIKKDKDGDLYASEERRFLNDLAEYLSYYNIFKPDYFTEIGLEIIETARSCIKAYDNKTGEFLHYFNKALSNRLQVAKGKRAAQERRQGLKVGDDTLIRKIDKFALMKGYDLSDISTVKRLCSAENILDIIAEFCCVAKKDVIQAIRTRYETAVLGEFTVNNDGDEISVFDTLNQGLSPDIIIEGQDEVVELLKSIARAYVNCRGSQKPILKELISIKLIPLVLEIESVTESCMEYDFWDVGILKQYRLTGLVPTARDIAAKYDVMEQSVSRTINNFFTKATLKC
ncbi:hypothetical protein LQZ19_04485 [Treponema primitia]|uniref:hypothetical protein n=1 Tax=Treponema primitia TaxID=88058 RepID=UPI0039811867